MSCIFAFSCRKSKDAPLEPISKDSVITYSLREQYSLPSAQWPTATLEEGVNYTELAILPDIPVDTQANRKIINLGKALFNDINVGQNISCARCHRQEYNFTDLLKVSTGGLQTHHRNTPTMENVWYLKELFHDGRATTFEAQITEAITSPVEMGENMETLPAKLASFGTYQPMFAQAFGDENITAKRITDAIAIYSQTISSGKGRFDKFLEGDKAILTDREIDGLHLFRTKAGCINCHNGPMFTDLQYHNLGYSSPSNFAKLDSGRYHVTGLREDIGKFRTPGLRNVSKTYPYFHNGALATLRDVIDAKNNGMPRTSAYLRVGTLSAYIKPLGLTDDEKEAIIAFLQTLSSD